MGLWVLAGAYCSQQLTDGFVPEWWVGTHSRGIQYALALEKAGLWARVQGPDEHSSGWQFHDWTQANPSREDVLAEREKAKKRQRAWRASRRDNGVTNGVTDGVTDAVSNGVSHAAPTRPDPTHKTETPSLSPRKRATSTPDLFPISDEMAAWGREHAPLVVDPRAETAKFLDHHRAKGSTFKDWQAAWRTWMRNAQTYAERAGVKPASPSSDPHKEHLAYW